MIIFTVVASMFIAAGKIETLLKDAGIRYTTKMVNGAPARRKHMRVTPEMVKDILGYLATHRDETNKEVGKHFGTGSNTIWRIRNGTHPLCQKVS